ncbi:MAG: GNAT family N-acetyltransferase [Pyrinomonadaceae bacterium]|nr:GNAT family N-acetyltransferase [Pyrinomonadaceae bacterium]
MSREWHRGEFSISTERGRLDLPVIHNFLAKDSYWAQGRGIETVKRSIENSLNFGLYKGGQQIGFARVVTDHATFAWLADVFVLDAYRGRGLGKWLIEVILSHPELQELRRWVLGTKDAHEIYRQFGFSELKQPERWMERPDPRMQETPDYWQDAAQ